MEEGKKNRRKMKSLLDAEMDALVKANIYPNKEELFRDAFRTLLRVKPNLKMESAISLYLSKEISFARAAEITGISSEEFKEFFAERGMAREVEPSSDETFTRAREFLKGKTQ